MLKNFRHKGLKELHETSKTKRIDKSFHTRILRRLDALHSAESIEDLTVPGFNFHGLTGFKPKRYTIHVNGPWCITFTFEGGNAGDIDFENYHER